MKNQFFAALILLVGLVSFQSCETPAPAPEKPEVFTPSTENVISLTDFSDWQSNWENHAISFLSANSPDILNSFTVKEVDLTEVMGERPAQVRYYLGLEFAGLNRTSTDTIWTPHLMIVGVNDLGADMIDPTQNEYVYDMVCPCPKQCKEICK